MIFYFLFLSLLIFIDATFQFNLFGFHIVPQFSTLLLFYLGFRKGYWFILNAIFFFVLLSSLFTRVNFISIFVSYFVVMFVVYHLRHGFFTESYLVHAFWVTVFSFILNLILALSLSFGVLFDLRTLLTQLILSSLFLGVLTVPVFLFLDGVDDFIYRKFSSASTM